MYLAAQIFAPSGTDAEWGLTPEFAQVAIWPPKKYYDVRLPFQSIRHHIIYPIQYLSSAQTHTNHHKTPFQFLIDCCIKADRLLCVNPVWFKTMTTFAVCYNLPYYFLALYAFIRGKEIIRIPSIIWAVIMTVFLWTMIAEQKYGIYPSQNFDEIFIPYVAFAIIPWIVVLRVIGSHPFTKPIVQHKSD